MNCSLCARAVRRSHGGVMVCPRCDLNELPATPKPGPPRSPAEKPHRG